MKAGHFDALVVGSGPAGSIAATVLARGGARVALVDKAKFPRDKACGDLVGPRGVQLLSDLGITIPGALKVDDMIVVGPTSRRVRLPCYPGRTYPGHGFALRRVDFDAALHEAAVDAGAEEFIDRAADPLWGDGGLEGFALSSGTEVRADTVIGADGASSRVATAADLVDPSRVLWGFAVRGYVEESVDVPYIVLWEHAPWRAFPGYGWLFPGPDGCGNVGLGLGTLSSPRRRSGRGARVAGVRAHAPRSRPARKRSAGADARRLAQTRHGRNESGARASAPHRRRRGTREPTAGRRHLPGNGQRPRRRAGRPRRSRPPRTAIPGVSREHLRAVSIDDRPGARRALAATRASSRLSAVRSRRLRSDRSSLPGWSIFWNDLLDGAQPSVPRAVAAVAAGIGRRAIARGRMREWFTATLGPGSGWPEDGNAVDEAKGKDGVRAIPQQGSTDQGRLPCHW